MMRDRDASRQKRRLISGAVRIGAILLEVEPLADWKLRPDLLWKALQLPDTGDFPPANLNSLFKTGPCRSYSLTVPRRPTTSVGETNNLFLSALFVTRLHFKTFWSHEMKNLSVCLQSWVRTSGQHINLLSYLPDTKLQHCSPMKTKCVSLALPRGLRNLVINRFGKQKLFYLRGQSKKGFFEQIWGARSNFRVLAYPYAQCDSFCKLGESLRDKPFFVRTANSLGKVIHPPHFGTRVHSSVVTTCARGCGLGVAGGASIARTSSVCTRACAVWGYFVFLLYSSLNVCSTVKFDGSYYGDKVIWTGLCSRTLLKWSEYSNVSCLVASRTSVTRSTASRPATS